MERPLNNSPLEQDAAAVERPARQESFLGELLRFALLALLIVVPVRLFIAQPFIVSGASMEDTFTTGQYLIVDQLTYHFEDPKRGDVIVFRYPNDPSKFFIKRVIGIPGDTVTVENGAVTVANGTDPNGVTLSEPYVDEMHTTGTLRKTLGDGEYFVMGDNRDASSDSRAWGILPAQNIIGRAYLRLFPLSVLSVLPGEYDLDAEFTSGSVSP
jgi:signal peptidase I